MVGHSKGIGSHSYSLSLARVSVTCTMRGQKEHAGENIDAWQQHTSCLPCSPLSYVVFGLDSHTKTPSFFFSPTIVNAKEFHSSQLRPIAVRAFFF